MARVPGRAQSALDIRALAGLAAQVHSPCGIGFGHWYSRWCRDTSTAPPRACRRPKQWAQALELWRFVEPPYETWLIHRDLHPGNLLWFRGALTGVVDWADACVGPASIDIAICPWNLQDLAGQKIASEFVSADEEITGRLHNPYWDVAKIVEDDWDLIDRPEQVWAAEELLTQAIPRLVRVLSAWDGEGH